MRIPLLLAAFALPTGLAAQTELDLYGRVGVTVSSKLVEDQIGAARITTKAGPALTVLAGGAYEAFPRYRVGLELQFNTGSYSAETAGQGETDLGSLSTFSATLGLSGPVIHRLRWRASLGVLKYLPGNDQGIFLRGGPTDLLLGFGVEYRHSLSRTLDIMFGLVYDYHRFTTEELQAQGFSQSQQVSRIGLTVGIARGGRP